MKLSVRCNRRADDSFGFEFSAAGAPYAGVVRFTLSDGVPQRLNIDYTTPRNEVVTSRMREEFDPFVIEEVLRELSTPKDTAHG